MTTEPVETLPAESSPANPSGGAAAAAQGATQDSPPVENPTDANAVTESSPVEGAKPRNISEAMDAAISGDPQPEAAQATDSPPEAEADAGNAEEAGEGHKDDPTKAAEAAAEQVPFHKHPVWQKHLAKEKALAGQVEQLQPKAQVVDELMTHTGGQDGFNNLRVLARQFAEDPAAAVPMLEQLLDDARGRSGLKLVSQDLIEKVNNGELDETHAIEVEKSRAVVKTAEQRKQETSQRQQMEQAKATQEAQVSALNAWEENVSRDPDYASMKDMVEDKAARLLQGKIAELRRPLSPAEMVGVAQAAYDAVRQQLGKLMPKPGAIRSGPKPGSSVTARVKPKSLDEAMDAALKG